MRFATRYFTRDLWAAADCYFQGQSFSSAARVLEEYLHHEARQWNSMALVRLGQSRLAPRRVRQARSPRSKSASRCIPATPASYQARLEAARAYQQTRQARTKAERAAARPISTPTALTPASPEWRDSLFALGHLLYEPERYDEAVDALDEAVDAIRQTTAHAAGQVHDRARVPQRRRGAGRAAARAAAATTNRRSNRSRKLIQEYLENAHATYLDVQQTITLAGSADDDPLTRTLLRNCYMMQGSVLLELRRFEEARQAYQNVITLYQNDPVVLESFVQVANCWRRLDQPAMARGNLEQAKVVLGKLPKDADFLASTNFNRQQWELLLDEMSKW